jgi:hypothetical protein
MLTAEALRGFVNTLTVNAVRLNAEQAQAALVREAAAARDRVLAGKPRPSGYRQIVDGIEGATLTAVKPDGVIVFAWQYLGAVVQEIRAALIARSPRDTGEYIAGIVTLVDGHEGDPEAIDSEAREVQIVATVPYARRLEVGKRKDGSPFVVQVAPHIVEETAIVGRRLYGDLAMITFGYVDLSDAYALRTAASHRRVRGRLVTDVRYPAITIVPRTA